MILLDKQIFKGIFETTKSILKNNFFYDPESLAAFCDVFTMKMVDEYCLFEQQADIEFKQKLKYDQYEKRMFTRMFMSFYLYELLVQYLHFSEPELDMFENILPKFAGVNHVKYESDERASY